MKKKEKEELEQNGEGERHTVQVSDKAWKVLTVLKLMYKKSLGNLIEESAMNMIRSTPFGIAHLNFFLSSQQSDIIAEANDNGSQVKKTSRMAGRKTMKHAVKKASVKAAKKGGVKNVARAS